MNLDSAYTKCFQITRNHYENFPVASFLLPAPLRKHIAAIYAFARTADDFADEFQDRERLKDWRHQLLRCTDSQPENPIFMALSHTIKEFDLPVQWLDNLLTAFRLDLDKNRFASWSELESYCRYSANPVGRLILWLFGYRTEELMVYADQITTALQLTNFWQDISIDLQKDKIYIPTNLIQQYGLTENSILMQQSSPDFGMMMGELIEKTVAYFERGLPLLDRVSGRLRWELKFTLAGGQQILQKAEKHKQDLLQWRPTLSKWDWIKLAVQNIF
jgi:squalene synthase HpnC